MRFSCVSVVCALFGAAFANAEIVPGLEVYGELALVDEIVCATDEAHAMRDFPAGASYATNILGAACRALPHTKKNAEGKESGALLSYRIGEGKELEANAAYVLVVEYPEDAPRAMTVINNGNESRRGLHTGMAAGDALTPKYVNNFCEVLDIPLSGAWEQWAELMFLNEKTMPYNVESPTLRPADGFDVTVALMPQEDDVMSHGAAVRAIRLYKVLDEAAVAAPLNLPDGLPHRHLFWREEMADGANKNFIDPLTWYEHKARLMRFLGMNTFSKDLLEFGYWQDWDPTYKDYGDTKWINYSTSTKDLWGRIVELMASYDYNIFPYYEYAGARGTSESLGDKRLAWPLKRRDNGRSEYTQTAWIESAMVDITSEAAHEDFRKILDCTVVRYKDKARFVGAWIRSRMQMPISFHDNTIALFSAEANGGVLVTQAELLASFNGSDRTLYNAYIDWWFLRRKAFFTDMRDFMRENGIDDATVLYSHTSAESGEYMSDWYGALTADTAATAAWSAAGYTDTITTITNMARRFYADGLKGPWPNWGYYEYYHAAPQDDPENYGDADGLALAYPFNRVFTVRHRAPLDEYRNTRDLALIRHYSLNENMMFDTADTRISGYFTADFERAGRACMQSEVIAMAQGDPTKIGYLVGANFGRGFSVPVREFNQNFLALPALPSEIVFAEGNVERDAVTLRRITTETHGTFFSLTHTGYTPRKNVRVTFPDDIDAVYESVSGRKHLIRDHMLTLDMDAFQLLTLTTVSPDAPVFNVAVRNVTETSADIVCDVLAIAADAGVLVAEYSDDIDFANILGTFVTPLDEVRVVTNRLDTLADSATYYLRVALTNSAGTVTVATKSFSTPRTEYVPVFTAELVGESYTRGAAIVTISDFGRNAATADITVRYSASPNLAESRSVAVSGVSAATTRLALPGLLYDTQYYALVTVENNRGRAFTSGVIPFKTPGLIAPPEAERRLTPGLLQVLHGCVKYGYPDTSVQTYGHATEEVVPGTIMDETRTTAINPFTGNEHRWIDLSTYAYLGYMYMVGGVTYNFAGIIDDGVTLNIAGKQLIRGKTYSEFGKGAFTPPTNGWYAIDVRLFEYDGGKGPSAHEINVWGEDMGFAWNTNGLTAPVSQDGWQRLRDPGDGSFLRTKSPLPNLAFIDTAVYDARVGGVSAVVRTESITTNAHLFVSLFSDPDAVFSDARCEHTRDAGTVEVGTDYTEVSFDNIDLGGADEWFVSARLVFPGYDARTEPVRVGDATPEPAFTADVSATNLNNATLRINLSRLGFGAQRVTLYAEYAQAPDFANPVPVPLGDVSALGVFEHQLADLSPATSYRLRICATNDLGRATAAPDIFFATPACDPPAFATTLGNVSITSAYVAVCVAGLGTGGATSADVVFTCTPLSGNAAVAESVQTIDAPQDLAHTFENLANGTAYTLRVAVSNNLGNVAYAPPISFRTLEPAVFGAHEIVLSGDGIGVALRITITELNVDAATLRISLNHGTLYVAELRDIREPGVYTVQLDGLSPNKQYDFDIAAVAGDITGATSVTGDFATVYAVTNDWFTVDFEDYIPGSAWTNTVDLTGTWTATLTPEDATAVVPEGDANALDFVLQERSSVTYMSAQPAESGRTVVLELRVKIVAGEHTADDASADGNVEKTAIMFVDDGRDVHLCARVTAAAGTNEWVQLSHPQVALQDGTWVDVSVELDSVTYDAPMVRFCVNGFYMADADGTQWFPIANLNTLADAEARTVRGIELLNAGTLDRFAGRFKDFPGLDDLLFAFFGFVNNVADDDLIAALDPATTRTENVPRGDTCEIVLPEQHTVGNATLSLAMVVIFTNATEFVECGFDAASEFFVDQNDGTQKFVYGTAGMDIASTPYPVRIYYVGTQTVGPTQNPIIGAGGGHNALQFVTDEKRGEYFVVNITNPEADIYYTAFVAESLDDTFTASVSAQAAAGDATLQLAIPADSATLFVQIVASATPFETGAEMPAK